MAVTALVARRSGRVNVVDVTWGLGFVARRRGLRAVSATRVALAAARRWSRSGGCGSPGTSWRRSRGEGEDPRYAEMLGDGGFACRGPQGVPRPGRGPVVRLAAAAGRRRHGTGAGRGWSGLGVARLGVGLLFEVGRRRPARGVPAGPATAAAGAGHRPVGLDPAPELLRRRLRLVGHLARRRPRGRLAAGADDRCRPAR